jgi:hypothetical protein
MKYAREGLPAYFIGDSEKQHLPCSLHGWQKGLLLAACACVLVPNRAWSYYCGAADAANVLPAPCLLLCVHGLGLLASSVRATARKEKTQEKNVWIHNFGFFEVNYGELLKMGSFFLSYTLRVVKL